MSERISAMPDLILTIVMRWRETWRDSVASAVAAGLAWVLAQHLFGHSKPLFAAISAIICLSPGLPSHAAQALGLLVGVAIGIVVGELSLFLPEGWPLLRLGVAAFVAIVAAATFGLPPVVPIQSGVSAILVLAFGPETAGVGRMLDVAGGAVIGLLFSQVLITPDPIGDIDNAARNLFDELAKGLRKCAEALQENDPATAEVGLRRLSAARRSVASLDAEIQAACNAARWSLRGRFAAREIGAAAQRYDCKAIQLYASTLLLGQALASALREVNMCVPNGLHERIIDASERCKSLVGPEGPEPVLAGERQNPQSPGWRVAKSALWRSCLEHMTAVEAAMATFDKASKDEEGPGVGGQRPHKARPQRLRGRAPNKILHRSGDGRCHVCERNGDVLCFQPSDPMG
jgi:uncharacterized membrane protein YgaE (UPF0421/DUF939 family)